MFLDWTVTQSEGGAGGRGVVTTVVETLVDRLEVVALLAIGALEVLVTSAQVGLLD